MDRRTRLRSYYWPTQILGWLVFVSVFLFQAFLTGDLSREAIISASLIFFLGIGLTHGFRYVLHRLEWQRKSVPLILPRVILSAVFLGALFTFIYGAISDEFLSQAEPILVFHDFIFLTYVINFSLPFLLWLTIYFAVKVFDNFKREEIEKLKLKAANTEMELNSFKAQMNPHFMFNSMNSIRALIDDHPDEAKEAITILSGMLRQTLILGRRSTVLLSEELDVVQKYLAIEKIRFEERLRIEVEVEPGLLEVPVPPLMIQTIAENAVKHGISKQKEGGLVKLTCVTHENRLVVKITNSGKLKLKNNESGFGVNNTRKRLELLYGEKASFALVQKKGFVEAILTIPL